ncbi:MAG TPA: hypothetical protein VF839_00915 [Clostridium sp.]
MKKFITIFSIFLFLSFGMNTTITIAQPTQNFSEGFYNVEALKLVPNVSYNVRNVSSSRVLLIIVDGNQVIQQVLRFESNSKQYVMIPLQFEYKIIIIGDGQLSFTT